MSNIPHHETGNAFVSIILGAVSSFIVMFENVSNALESADWVAYILHLLGSLFIATVSAVVVFHVNLFLKWIYARFRRS